MSKRRRRRRRRVALTPAASRSPRSPRHLSSLSPATTQISRDVTGLPEHKTARTLRQTSMLEAQRRLGNSRAQELLTTRTGPARFKAGLVQRALSKEEKLKNLTSSRFADDARLQLAFDNAPPMRQFEKDHEAVKKVQQALIDSGFPMPVSTKKTGAPDGIFGGETYKAVKAFQGAHSLDVDGVVGRETLGRLDELYGGPAPPQTTPAEDPEIEATEEELGKHIVAKMNKANHNKPDSGIWYAHKRREYHNKFPAVYSWNEDWRTGYADPAYFVRVGAFDWLLKPGVSASAAIKSWFKGLTIAECASTLTAIEIDTVRAAIGDKKFDDMFGTPDKPIPPQQRLRIKQNVRETPIAGFIVRTEPAKKNDPGTKNNRPAKVGDWYYFYNHPKYLLKHPDGAWQGENSVYAGRNKAGLQLWSGLGASDKTEDDLLDDMMKAYNGERTEQDYERIVKYRTIRTIPDKSPSHPTYKSLYDAYLNRVDPKYRHDQGHFKVKLDDKQEILDHEAYEIDGVERKGGFLPKAGRRLDAAKLKAIRES